MLETVIVDDADEPCSIVSGEDVVATEKSFRDSDASDRLGIVMKPSVTAPDAAIAESRSAHRGVFFPRKDNSVTLS